MSSTKLSTEEMKHLLQIIVNHLTKTINVYNIPDFLSVMVVSLNQIQKEWKRYLNSNSSHIIFEDVMKEHQILGLTLVDYLTDDDALKDFILNKVQLRVSKFPKIKSSTTIKILKENNRNLLDYIKQGEEFIIDEVSLECVKEEMKHSKREFINIENLHIEGMENILKHSSKSSRFILSRSLLNFQWDLREDSKLDKQVLKYFLESTNPAHLSIVLFFKMKRELEYYSEMIHDEIEQSQSKLLKKFKRVSDVLDMNVEEFEKLKSCCGIIYKTMKKDNLQAVKSIISEEFNKKGTKGGKKKTKQVKEEVIAIERVESKSSIEKKVEKKDQSNVVSCIKETLVKLSNPISVNIEKIESKIETIIEVIKQEQDQNPVLTSNSISDENVNHKLILDEIYEIKKLIVENTKANMDLMQEIKENTNNFREYLNIPKQ